MSKNNHTRQLGPDILRALAVSLVFLSHCIPWNTAAEKTGVNALAFWGYQMGFWGVEIFFVLSGYLIGGILLAELFSGRLLKFQGLLDFWRRRWFRTLPNYYLFLLLFYVLAWTRHEHTQFHLLSYIGFSQNLIGEHPSFFGTAWSLAVEEWFYLLFPVTLLGIARFSGRSKMALVFSIAIFMFVPICLRLFIDLSRWDIGYRQSTFMRLDALMYGVILAYIKQSNFNFWKKLIPTWWVGLIIFCLLMAYWHNDWNQNFSLEHHSLFHRAFIFSAVSTSLFFIFPKIISLEGSRLKIKAIRVLILKLSLWSYSIYLSHPLFIHLTNTKILPLWEWPIPLIRVAFSLLVVTILTLTCSAILYRIYEQPLMKLRDKF
jgi:peptidoglycan/LPS O-acetylase OafA/YrhL